MSTYVLIYIAVLVFSGRVSFKYGEFGHKLGWFSMLVHWAIAWFVIAGTEYSIAYYAFLHILYMLTNLWYRESGFGDFTAVLFALMVINGFLAYHGVVSVERGLGHKYLTYWNIQAWLLIFVCLNIAGAAWVSGRQHA